MDLPWQHLIVLSVIALCVTLLIVLQIVSASPVSAAVQLVLKDVHLAYTISSFVCVGRGAAAAIAGLPLRLQDVHTLHTSHTHTSPSWSIVSSLGII